MSAAAASSCVFVCVRGEEEDAGSRSRPGAVPAAAAPLDNRHRCTKGSFPPFLQVSLLLSLSLSLALSLSLTHMSVGRSWPI